MDEGGRSTHTTGSEDVPPFSLCDKGEALKKYLVVKMAEGWSHVVNWVVMPGLYTMEAAQQFVASAVADEPDARYMIQEVGAA
jgi:hypothetical protein